MKVFLAAMISLLMFLATLAILLAPFTVCFQLSNQVVSGIVYNTSNDRFISGATCFSIRAAVDTYVTEENQSSYCIPGNSPYKALVNKAAANKDIKVKVEAHKYFTIKAPWVVYPNVSVTEVK